jgi:hypothetical protein
MIKEFNWMISVLFIAIGIINTCLLEIGSFLHYLSIVTWMFGICLNAYIFYKLERGKKMREKK